MKRSDLRTIVIVLLFVVGVPLMGCVLVGLYAKSIVNDLNTYGETLTRDLGVPPHAVLGTRSVCSPLQVCTVEVVYTAPESWENLIRNLNQVRRLQAMASPSVLETSVYRYSYLPGVLAEVDVSFTIANSTEYPVRLGNVAYRDEAKDVFFTVNHYSAYDDKPFVIDGLPMTENIIIISMSRSSKRRE